MSKVHTCRFCYSVVHGHFCEQCAKDHAEGKYRPMNWGRRKKGSPTLDRQEGNREEYFGDSSE